jgi:hypothetical protein
VLGGKGMVTGVHEQREGQDYFLVSIWDISKVLKFGEAQYLQSASFLLSCICMGFRVRWKEG